MAPPFVVEYLPDALAIAEDLVKTDQRRARKVAKAVRQLASIGPSYPGLNSHKFDSLTGPNGEEVWESYVENKTPGAWRIFWIYGPAKDVITIVNLSKHP